MAASAFDDALALNNAHAVELSIQTPQSFQRLIDHAFLAEWTPQRDAFLIAFDQSAAYDSLNFLWFRARFERFVYIDRVVVRPEARGRGRAAQLYHRLFALAATSGHDKIVCEVNVDPPNPASDAFHARLGFVDVGRTVLPGGLKSVRYLRCDLPTPSCTLNRLSSA